jgi:hypothetical protein
MDHALEASGQRDHVRSPLARRPNLLMETPGNIVSVSETIPGAHGLRALKGAMSKWVHDPFNGDGAGPRGTRA